MEVVCQKKLSKENSIHGVHFGGKDKRKSSTLQVIGKTFSRKRSKLFQFSFEIRCEFLYRNVYQYYFPIWIE